MFKVNENEKTQVQVQEKSPTLVLQNEILLAEVAQLESLAKSITRKLYLIEPARSGRVVEDPSSHSPKGEENCLTNSFGNSLERLAKVRHDLEDNLEHLNQII